MHTRNKIILLLIFVSALRVHAQGRAYIVNSFGEIYKVNLSSCTATSIGFTTAQDIAVTPNKQLWGVATEKVFRIDTINASISSVITDSNITSKSLVGLNDTVLVAFDINGDLVTINVSSGVVASLGAVLYAPSGDLAWVNNQLYLSSIWGLVKMQLNNSNTAILSATAVNTVIINSVNWGLGSAKFPGNINYLIGTQGNDITKICYLSGSFETLCPTIIDAAIYGMATNRELEGSFQCKGVGAGIEGLTDSKTISITPNPCRQEATIQTNFDLQDALIKLYNSVGIEIASFSNIPETNLTLNVSDFSPGIYSLQILYLNHIYSSKILVVHD